MKHDSTDPRRLLVAIHDVGPRFEREIDTLREHVARHVQLSNVARLVVPNHWGEAPLVEGSPFARRLRKWAEGGADVFVHGWFHRDEANHRAIVARLKARHMTAGEGEFLGLDVVEARRRMTDGKASIEDIIGRPTTGFVAPAWLYGEPARVALRQSGFALAEDHTRVWRPATGEIVCRGPVLTWASRSRARIASSLLAARVLPPLLRRAAVVRVAVHPGDVGVPSLLASISRSLDRLTRTHRPSRYTDLLPESRLCAS